MRTRTWLLICILTTTALLSPARAAPLLPEAALRHRMLAARSLPGTPVVYLGEPAANPPNVQRVMRLVPQQDFQNTYFPMANPIYSYRAFLMAVAKFPAFCNETTGAVSLDQACARELATLFAHMTQETGDRNPHLAIPQWQQGLVYVRMVGCSDHRPGCTFRGASCRPGHWASNAWPCPKGSKYYGRGAIQVSYNYNYGRLSEALFGDRMVLLRDPDRMARQGWLAFASAIWFTMTPQSPKPSVHNVVTGFWSPNAADRARGLAPGFGLTTLIINGGIACGRSKETPDSRRRIALYRAFAKALGVSVGSHLGCAGLSGFSARGAGAVPAYWRRKRGAPAQCERVRHQTPYSAYSRLGYLRCIGAPMGTAHPRATHRLRAPDANCLATPLANQPRR